MNRKEMLYLMAIMRTAYPEYYRQQNDIEDTVNLWLEMLEGDDPIIISKAVKEFIKNDDKGFPPKIGQIREMAKSIRRQEIQDEKMRDQQKKLAEPLKVRSQEEIKDMESAISKIRKFLNEL